MTVEAFSKLYPAEFYARLIEAELRPDGRQLLEVRPTVVNANAIGTADGSAFVRLASYEPAPGGVRTRTGSTSVLAGVTGQVGVLPRGQSIAQLYVNVELTPVCNAQLFRAGPPSPQAQALSSRLNALVQHIQLLDVANLVVPKRPLSSLSTTATSSTVDDDDEEDDDQLVWFLNVDIYCLEYGGNLFDSCLAALVAALRDTRLPQAFVDPLNPDVVQCLAVSERHAGVALLLNKLPLSLTFGALLDQRNTIADPNADEESLLVDSYTLVLDADDLPAQPDQCRLLALYKNGGASVDPSRLVERLADAHARVSDLAQLIRQAARRS